MKNLLLTFALLLTFGTLSVAQVYQVNPKVANNLKVNTRIKYPQKFVYRPNCPDLAAYELKVEKVSGGTYSGRIKISGVVKNIGAKPFVSNPNQATAALYEVFPGGRKVLLRKMSLSNIPAGRTMTLPTVYRNWSTSNEFPPSYQLVIMYDPDITLDNNPRNDDCNRSNNKKEIDGYQIHRIFRAGR